MLIRRFVLSVMLAGAFLGGYRLGQNPNSPDLWGMATKGYVITAEVGKKLVTVLGGEIGPLTQTSSRAIHD